MVTEVSQFQLHTYTDEFWDNVDNTGLTIFYISLLDNVMCDLKPAHQKADRLLGK